VPATRRKTWRRAHPRHTGGHTVRVNSTNPALLPHRGPAAHEATQPAPRAVGSRSSPSSSRVPLRYEKKKPRFRNLSSFFVQTEPKSPPLKSARFITNRLVNRSIKPGEKNKRGKEKEGGEQARGRETWRGRVGGREGGRPSHSPAGFGSIWAAPHTQQAEISAGRKRQTHLRSSRRRRGHHW
jgi:hypothetical protein